MGRFPRAATRIATAGALSLLVGAGLVATVAVQALSAPAYADTAPFEVVCGGSPLGAVALNDVVVSGTISPADPAPGQQFDLDGVQLQVPLPASLLDEVPSSGPSTTWSGSLTATVDATGAEPATLPTGAVAFSSQVPSPAPSAGVVLDAPTSPVDIGPFTATAGAVSLALAPTTALDLDVGGIALSLSCSSYPNDIVPVSGVARGPAPGLPVSPVIAVAGGASPPPPAPALTGPYELYCPHTPVGDLVFNGVTTTATVSRSGLSAGDSFRVAGYQTHIPVPAGLVTAAAGLANDSFDGLAAGAVDVEGAGPGQVSTGSMAFDVPFPSPVPSGGVGLDLPAAPLSLGPFTADGGPVTVAQDPTLMVVASLSSKAFTMTCTAYPDDDEATSGSTGTAPAGPAIEPIIALGSASGGLPTTTTTTTGLPEPFGSTPPTTGPYELFCPGSPVGNIVLNDTTTTATVSPSALEQGDTFGLGGLQMQLSLPQSVVQQAEALGLTRLTGDASLFLDATGVDDGGFVPVDSSVGTSSAPGAAAVATSASGSGGGGTVTDPGGPVVVTPPFPQPVPGPYDMPFDVALPDPVPAGGVQFTLTPSPGDGEAFVASGGPISVTVGGVDIDATEFGDSFGMFCEPYPNDTEPTGLASVQPDVAPANPLVASGTATIPPPAPSGPGPYELYCPGTPVGAIAINDVTSSATLSPPDPSPGQQFSVTGYQSHVTLPADITAAAAALGNDAITGTATTTFGAEGATPTSVPSGTMDFDAPIPDPAPTGGLVFAVPGTPKDIGTFTATGSTLTITQGDQVALTLEGTGTDTAPLADATCTAYPDDLLPSGIVDAAPWGAPIEPVLVTTAPVPPPPQGQSGPYELYCPGTPVGDIALNDVVSSASLSPPDPAPGQQFDVTGYQTTVRLPAEIVTATAALGNPSIEGEASGLLDAGGATPASISTGTLAFNVPIPAEVPGNGLALALPPTPSTIGPFTATASPVTISQDSHVELSIVVSGSELDLGCQAYPDDSVATGIVSGPPDAVPEAPVIVTGAVPPPPTSAPTPTTSAGDASTTTAPVAPTDAAPGGPTTSVPGSTITTASGTTPGTADPGGSSTTAAAATITNGGAGGAGPATKGASDPSVTPASVVTAPASSLAFTGAGAQLRWLLLVGVALSALGLALLFLVDAPRRFLAHLGAGGGVGDGLRRALHRGGGTGAGAEVGRPGRAGGLWQPRR